MPATIASLILNGTIIVLDRFVRLLITGTVLGMMGALKGGESTTIDAVGISIRGEKVDITINGNHIAVNGFVNDFVRNTIFSMVGRLKGVTQPVQSLELKLN
jgi:hypothetical protein